MDWHANDPNKKRQLFVHVYSWTAHTQYTLVRLPSYLTSLLGLYSVGGVNYFGKNANTRAPKNINIEK